MAKPGNVNDVVPYVYQEYPKMVGSKVAKDAAEEEQLKKSLPSVADLDKDAAEKAATAATSDKPSKKKAVWGK